MFARAWGYASPTLGLDLMYCTAAPGITFWSQHVQLRMRLDNDYEGIRS